MLFDVGDLFDLRDLLQLNLSMHIKFSASHISRCEDSQD